MRLAARLVIALGWMLLAFFVPASASYAVDCTATPEDPACVEPAPTVVQLDNDQFAGLLFAGGALVALTSATLVLQIGSN